MCCDVSEQLPDEAACIDAQADRDEEPEVVQAGQADGVRPAVPLPEPQGRPDQEHHATTRGVHADTPLGQWKLGADWHLPGCFSSIPLSS